VTHGGGNDVKVVGMRSKRRTDEEDEAQRCTVVEEARWRGEGLGAWGHGPLLIVLRSFSHYDRQLHLLGDGRQLHLLDGVEQGGPCPKGGASREDKGGGRSSGGGVGEQAQKMKAGRRAPGSAFTSACVMLLEMKSITWGGAQEENSNLFYRRMLRNLLEMSFFLEHQSGGSHDPLPSFYGCGVGFSWRQP
jgi:hypothetical protein